jgi:hypothetical protein
MFASARAIESVKIILPPFLGARNLRAARRG